MSAEERRQQDRRAAERRAAARAGKDRRQTDRRASAVAGAALAVTVAFGSASDADAQIYTRKNANGTVEATNVPDSGDFRLTYPGKGTLIHSRAWRLRPSYNGEYNRHIEEAASLHGVSVALVRTIIQVESAFDAQAVSSKGAQGLMQLMPATARRFGVTDAFDPRQNIFAGVKYLRVLLDMFNGDVTLAAAGYNAGENAVVRYNGVPPYRETRGYVEKVRALLDGISAGFTGSTSARNTAPVLSPATFIVPNDPHYKAKAVGSSVPASRVAVKARAAKPRVFYRWKDPAGVLHVGQSPPAEGVTYSMIRALD
jgi:soluble lytic murein transglycosylase-like protein